MATAVCRDDRISLRVAPLQKETITAAARVLGRSITDFILSVSLAKAEEVLADRRVFHVADEQWDEFERLLDSPVTPNPGIGDLFAKPSVLVT